MDLVLDTLKVLARIFTILPLLLGVTLVMGKRSVGELPIFDFIVILLLGSMVGADIAEPKINHYYTVVAVIAVGVLQLIISHLVIKYRKIGKLLTFEPTVVIYKGQFLVGNLKKIKYSIDNVLQMLRKHNVYNIRDVEIGIIEANGQLSVKLIPSKEPVRMESLNLNPADSGLDLPVIIDGMIFKSILESSGLSEKWLMDELKKQKISKVSTIFYASINKKNELYISLKDDSHKPKAPHIYH